MSPLTGVLREAWATYKTYAAHFLVIAFVLYLGSPRRSPRCCRRPSRLAGSVAASVIDLFCMFLLQAALVKAVQDVRDGRVDLDLRGTLVGGAAVRAARGGRVDPGLDRNRNRVRAPHRAGPDPADVLVADRAEHRHR